MQFRPWTTRGWDRIRLRSLIGSEKNVDRERQCVEDTAADVLGGAEMGPAPGPKVFLRELADDVQ